MGYTHYFAYDPNAESVTKARLRIIDDARAIGVHVQEALGIRLANGVGEGQPEFTERWINLNGPSRRDLGHETFLLDFQPWKVWDEEAALGYQHWADNERRRFEERGFIWAFCKTTRKPYDIAVTSILLRCHHLAPDAFVIGSDGQWEREWQHGAMYWGAGCEPGTGPVEVVRTLFGQAETTDSSRIVRDHESGPPSAHWHRTTTLSRQKGRRRSR
jgi:hypothetical protein